MLPTLNYDAIVSDPLLLLAAVFLFAGPIVFLVALVKFLSWGRKQKLTDPYADINPFASSPEIETPVSPVKPTASAVEDVPPVYTPVPTTAENEDAVIPPAEPMPAAEPVAPAIHEAVADKTIVMPAGLGEIQGQLEIAFSQIKMLNKKIAQMESELESVARSASGKLDAHELKEMPMNPADFTQKLLKLAEHVIVLEREVERLKSSGGKKDAVRSDEALPPTPKIPQIPSAPKPPVMPL